MTSWASDRRSSGRLDDERGRHHRLLLKSDMGVHPVGSRSGVVTVRIGATRREWFLGEAGHAILVRRRCLAVPVNQGRFTQPVFQFNIEAMAWIQRQVHGGHRAAECRRPRQGGPKHRASGARREGRLVWAVKRGRLMSPRGWRIPRPPSQGSKTVGGKVGSQIWPPDYLSKVRGTRRRFPFVRVGVRGHPPRVIGRSSRNRPLVGRRFRRRFRSGRRSSPSADTSRQGWPDAVWNVRVGVRVPE